MRGRIFMLFFFILLLNSVFAQQHKVRLRIIEKGNQEPMIAAVVSYGNNIQNLNNHSVTDDKGVVVVSFATAKCYYKITSLGFVPQQGVLLATDKQKTITMQEDVMGLSEVVVTGSGTPTPLKASPVVTQVLSGKALVNAGYGDLQQALMQETPGMNIQKVGFGNEMNMQGLDARHILFLVDGERLTGEMAGNLDYERFNLHAIDRVEIVKGASSTLYGSRAAGAVVNLITKKTTKPFTITAGVRYAQHNERNYTDAQPKDFLYMYEKNSDKPNLQAWISTGASHKWLTTQTDIWYSASDAFNMYQQENDKKVYYASANPFLERDTTIVSRLSRPPMGISGSEHISVAQKIYIEPTTAWSVQLYGTYFFMNTYDLIQDLYFTQSKDFTVGSKIRYKWKDYLTATATLHSDFYERYKRHERRDIRKKVYDSRIWQPRLRLESNYFEEHKIIGGIDYLQDDLTSDRFVNQKMTTRGLKEWEFFVQDSYTINEKWNIEAGVRSTYSKPFGQMLLPKIALKYSPTDFWSFRMNYAMGYRSPSIKELFFNWDHLGMFQIIGDEELQPEKNHYFSLGTEYNNNTFFLSGNIYGNFFYDKIEGIWKIYDFQYNFEYMNLKNQRLLGLDMLMRWRISDNFLLNASYSYVNVEDSHGVRISTTSPHAATGGLTYRYSRPRYALQASLTGSFTGAKSFDVQDRLNFTEEYTKSNGTVAERVLSREAYFRCDLPAYAICNLNVTQTFRDKFKVSIGVNNLFDYVPQTLGAGITMFNIPATAGARAFVQLEYLF